MAVTDPSSAAPLASSGVALLAVLAILWRARTARGTTLAFWLMAATGAAVSTADSGLGHLLLAAAVITLAAAHGRAIGSLASLDVACLTASLTAATVMAAAGPAGVPLPVVLPVVGLAAAIAALAVLPGVPDAVRWALLGALTWSAGAAVVVVMADVVTLPPVVPVISAVGHGALGVAALLPAAAALVDARAVDASALRTAGISLLAISVAVLPVAYLVAELFRGGGDATLYVTVSAVVGALAVIRAAVARRAHDDQQVTNQEATQRFRALAEHGSDVTCVVDDSGAIAYASPSVLTTFGYRPEQVVATGWRNNVHLSDVRLVERACEEVRRAAGRQTRAEIRVRERGGKWRWVEATITNRLQDPVMRGLVCNLRDIDQYKQAQADLRDQARHDALTGLPNRTLLLERLQTALECGRRNTVAVAFLDLDHFKEINDSLGHETGDLVLIEVAKRIRDALRPGDVVARFGGDEFVVVCEQLTSRRDAISIIERLVDQVRLPVGAGGHELHVTPSVGIAFSTGDGDSPDALIRDADAAMYQAKADGRARHTVFDHSMRRRAMERLETGTGLHVALERNEFRVFYQPIVDVASGVIASVEALVRWQHPRHGLLGPCHFIDIAEERGLMSAIGEHVLSVAASDMRRWQSIDTAQPLMLAVNISAQQLRNPEFVRVVERVLAESGLDPARLCLEVTENVLLEHADAVSGALDRLKRLGVQIGIDDFGAGYTSLSYLKRFPVDIMKVDKSFVSGVCDNAQDAAIVAAVIDLAHTFETSTVAEGVETPAQLARLAELGCDLAQGFLFARPQPAHLVDELLVAQRSPQRLLPRTSGHTVSSPGGY